VLSKLIENAEEEKIEEEKTSRKESMFWPSGHPI
jgi:hypothetical protein